MMKLQKFSVDSHNSGKDHQRIRKLAFGSFMINSLFVIISKYITIQHLWITLWKIIIILQWRNLAVTTLTEWLKLISIVVGQVGITSPLNRVSWKKHIALDYWIYKLNPLNLIMKYNKSSLKDILWNNELKISMSKTKGDWRAPWDERKGMTDE